VQVEIFAAERRVRVGPALPVGGLETQHLVEGDHVVDVGAGQQRNGDFVAHALFLAVPAHLTPMEVAVRRPHHTERPMSSVGAVARGCRTLALGSVRDG
jgi:hypothetical protein